ncbi:U3 small nucleolar RNA-associated protein 14-like A, partial [Stylophora pistillata]
MAAEIALKIAPVLEDRERNSELDHGPDELFASDDEKKDSGDEEKYEKLLKEIRSLSSSGKKRVASQRSEPHKQVSEFHLSSVKDSTQQVDLNDLIGSLNNSNEYGSLKKKL